MRLDLARLAGGRLILGRSPHRDVTATQGNRMDRVGPRSPTLRFVWIAPSPLTARVDLPLPYCPILASSRLGTELRGNQVPFARSRATNFRGSASSSPMGRRAWTTGMAEYQSGGPARHYINDHLAWVTEYRCKQWGQLSFVGQRGINSNVMVDGTDYFPRSSATRESS